MYIQQLLNQTSIQLTSISTTPLLDSEVLLAHVLGVSRAHLHTWPLNPVLKPELQTFYELVQRRKQGEPVAYLLGFKEFWSLSLEVNQNVLIPRPETELLVEIILNQFPREQLCTVADLGTGSGAIALALAKENPQWEIWAIDNCCQALVLAKENAKHLAIQNVNFQLSDWCEKIPKNYFQIIVSNPPYIAEDDPHLLQPELAFEPKNALITAEFGYHDLQKIIFQAREYLLSDGLLLVEHGYNQAAKIREIFISAKYTSVVSVRDFGGNERVTMGRLQ